MRSGEVRVEIQLQERLLVGEGTGGGKDGGKKGGKERWRVRGMEGR